MRHFRAAPAVYAEICRRLDEAYGYPNAETKTERALPLASELPTDLQGRVYLQIESEVCDSAVPSQMLPQLLASGAVEEIDEATYQAAVQPQEP